MGDPDGIEADLSGRPATPAVAGRPAAAGTTTTVQGAPVSPVLHRGTLGTTTTVVASADNASESDDDTEAQPLTGEPANDVDATEQRETDLDEVPDGLNSKQTVAWIGGDVDRAIAALIVEEAREQPRVSVTRHIDSVVEES